MFREIVRKKQALSQEDCRQLLKTEKRGVLSVIGDDGYPYGVACLVVAIVWFALSGAIPKPPSVSMTAAGIRKANGPCISAA